MKKVTINVLIALCAAWLCVMLPSCQKENNSTTPDEPQPTEEFTLVGNWKSYNYQWIDEDGPFTEATGRYSAVFTETTAKMYLDFDGIDHTIESDYTFKEGDDSIIYFPKAYNEYAYKIVGQIYKTEQQLIIEVRKDDWDYFERYYFYKQ